MAMQVADEMTAQPGKPRREGFRIGVAVQQRGSLGLHLRGHPAKAEVAIQPE